MIEPLADGEESRLLKELSPNGTRDDFIEAHLTRTGKRQKIELRQMRPADPGVRARASRTVRKVLRRRSLYLTVENLAELAELYQENRPWPGE